MFLSHKTIEKYINDGTIIINPEFNKNDIRPIGIRIHLAKEILIPEENQTVDLTSPSEVKYKTINLEKEKFYLEPNQFILGATYESIQTPKDVVAILDGRSTVARLGLTTNVTATIADGTFEVPHVVVLEIKNLGNFRVRLKYKDPIAMMVFAKLTEPVEQKIQSQYGANQNKATPPNLNFKTGQDH